jgi:hypothetical protein
MTAAAETVSKKNAAKTVLIRIPPPPKSTFLYRYDRRMSMFEIADSRQFDRTDLARLVLNFETKSIHRF